MSQLALFTQPLARHDNPATSADAAAAVAPHAGTLEALILETFAVERNNRGMGLNDDELCELLAMNHAPTLKTARSRLTRRGLLVDSGTRRPSQRGRDSIVWSLA